MLRKAAYNHKDMAEERIIAVAFPALFRSMRELAKDFFTALRATVGDPPQWPQAQFYAVTAQETGGTGIGIVSGNDYSQSLRAAWLQVSTLPSHGVVAHELEELRVQGRTVGYWQSDLVAGFGFPILYKHVKAHPSDTTLNESEFEKFYGEVESYLSGTDVTVRVFLDLVNLPTDLSPIVLDESRRIIKLDRDTVQRLLERAYRTDMAVTAGSHLFVAFGASVMPRPQAGQTVLEVIVRFPKEKFSELSVILGNEANEAVTALRLSLPGSGFVRVLDYEIVGFAPDFGRYGFAEQRSAARFTYKLDTDASQDLARHWPDSAWAAKRLFTAPPILSAPLRIALERFNSSFERLVQTDRLLDFIIALEALCSRESDAASYRVALRVATLVARDAAERDNIFKLVSDSYSERSNLAHGRSSNLEGDEAVREHLLKLEAILLRTIHAFVGAEKREQHREDVFRIIDKAIRTQERTELESVLPTTY